MTELDREINTIIMQEIGLEVGKDKRIYDQDTGVALRVGGLDVIAPDCYNGRQSIEFDPYNNRKLMGQLFGYFLDKYSDETGLDVRSFYNVDNDKMECKFSNGEYVRSNSYKKDTLKYTDIIMQLNGYSGETDINLNKFDIIQKSTVRRTKKG